MDRVEPDIKTGTTTEPGLLVAVPFYRRPDLVAPCIEALARSANDFTALGAEILLYNDSPDDPALAAELEARSARLRSLVPFRIETNPANLGFVRTMNQAIRRAVERRSDLLMINSDALLEPGAVAEMHRVSRLDPMIGFVNPRSDNATLATLPVFARLVEGEREERLAAAAAFAVRLPELRFVPTAVGFCMLVRWHILAEFGGFDEIYGQGYNEENDLVMRAGRCGYRAVLANRAFASHAAEASFGVASISRAKWEKRNRALLDARYPEYAPYVASWSDAPETLAERLLAALVPDAHGKRAVAFDFSSFRADHNGTFRAGAQLLAAAMRRWGARYDVSVITNEDVYRFHDYAALGVPRVDPHEDRVFAAIFRVGQPYDWPAIQRLIARGAVIGMSMLDTISVDCPQLFSPRLYNMWQFAIDHLDLLVTQSRQTDAAFRARFRVPPAARTIISPHSRDLADYAPPASAAEADGSILVIGNHFSHKYLRPTAESLAAAFPDRTVVAFGASAPGSSYPRLRWIEGGQCSEAAIADLYAAAAVVIFPSHAEGFGFPVLHALAARKPVFARDLPAFEELRGSLGDNPNLHFFSTTVELVGRLRDLPSWIPFPSRDTGSDALRAADDILRGLEASFEHVEYERIVARIRAMQFASDISAPAPAVPAGSPPAAEAAHFLAESVERAARRILSWPAAYQVTRFGFRTIRRITGSRRPS